MSAKKECPREKKRTRIRQELYRMSDSEFRRRCADHIRAIRYLRLRNQELRFLNSFLRMQRLVRERSARHTVKSNNRIIGKINGKMEPKDWDSSSRAMNVFSHHNVTNNGPGIAGYHTLLYTHQVESFTMHKSRWTDIWKNYQTVFPVDQTTHTQRTRRVSYT